MPGYFAAMGIPLRAGRDFQASDDRQSLPVAIVNEALARREWPGGDAVGRDVDPARHAFRCHDLWAECPTQSRNHASARFSATHDGNAVDRA